VTPLIEQRGRGFRQRIRPSAPTMTGRSLRRGRRPSEGSSNRIAYPRGGGPREGSGTERRHRATAQSHQRRLSERNKFRFVRGISVRTAGILPGMAQREARPGLVAEQLRSLGGPCPDAFRALVRRQDEQREDRDDRRGPGRARSRCRSPATCAVDVVSPVSPLYGTTSYWAIIPASSCSRMWQWKTNRPRLSVNFIFTTTVSPMPSCHDSFMSS
jgi:hypothetical protein